jgi:hypothetical protein
MALLWPALNASNAALVVMVIRPKQKHQPRIVPRVPRDNMSAPLVKLDVSLVARVRPALPMQMLPKIQKWQHALLA